MKINFIHLSVIIFTSCSEDNSSEQLVSFEVSEKFSVDLSEVGLSSMREFPIALSSSNPNKFFIFNSFRRTIDSFSLEGGNGNVSQGNEIPFEGPNGVESFNYFIENNNHFIFLDHNSVYFPDSVQLKRIYFSKFPSMINEGLEYVSRGNSISDGFNFFDPKNSIIYLFFETFTNSRKQLISYNLIKNEIKLIDFELIDEMENHIITYWEGPLKASNPYQPILSVEENFLIISYPFSSKFHLYYLQKGEVQDVFPTSKLFKGEKALPDRSFDSSSFIDFNRISDTWQDDIKFGSFFKLGSDLYYRIVKGGKVENNSKKFIEVFDLKFNKIGESDLSNIEPDLGAFNIPIGDKIFIKSKTQNTEDVLDYYLITIIQN